MHSPDVASFSILLKKTLGGFIVAAASIRAVEPNSNAEDFAINLAEPGPLAELPISVNETLTVTGDGRTELVSFTRFELCGGNPHKNVLRFGINQRAWITDSGRDTEWLNDIHILIDNPDPDSTTGIATPVRIGIDKLFEVNALGEGALIPIEISNHDSTVQGTILVGVNRNINSAELTVIYAGQTYFVSIPLIDVGRLRNATDDMLKSLSLGCIPILGEVPLITVMASPPIDELRLN
jgi:hypothetical protein